MPWIDTHCHLEMLEPATIELLEKSQQAQVNYCITIGTDHASNQQIVNYTQTHPQVYAALGIHPHEADKATSEHLDWIYQQAQENMKILAIGECGYDYFYQKSTAKNQTKIFQAQLEIATELNLPVIIHSRDVEEEMIKILSPYLGKGLRGVFHCFTSSLRLAEFGLAAGFYLSFNGICTFKKSEHVRMILKKTPLDRILLETDAPYLAPEPFRGTTNYSGNVKVIGEYIADFLKMGVAELAQQTCQNVQALFQRFDGLSC